jgi:hypothetical protein
MTVTCDHGQAFPYSICTGHLLALFSFKSKSFSLVAKMRTPTADEEEGNQLHQPKI